MTTAFDWIATAIFAGLVVLFLQRSLDRESFDDDPMWRYLAAAVGCALLNYLGNEVSTLLGVAALFATIGFIVFELRPLPNFPRR